MTDDSVSTLLKHCKQCEAVLRMPNFGNALTELKIEIFDKYLEVSRRSRYCNLPQKLKRLC